MTKVIFLYTNTKESVQKYLVTITSDFLLLEVICLYALIVLGLIIIFQFIQQGIMIAFAFIQSYLALMYTDDFTFIFEPLKGSMIHAFIICLCQKLLLQTIINSIETTLQMEQLLQILGMTFVVVAMPKLFKQFFQRIGSREINDA